MAPSDLPPSDLGFIEESDGLEYRAVSRLAVLGLLAGLLSAGATLWPALWVVPPAGILLSGVALVRIRRAGPELTGAGLAVAGMVLCVFFAALIPTQRTFFRLAIEREARQVADVWFDSLRNDRPIEACQMTADARYRRPLAQAQQEAVVAESPFRESLEGFVAQSEVRCLLALGPNAEVRHYATEARILTPDRASIADVYAVTFEEGGTEKSFFVRLVLERETVQGTGGVDWTVASSRGGYQPVALGGDGK